MAHTYSISEIVGTSSDGLQAAIESGISRASKTVRNIDWFEVASVRGHADDSGVLHYQVTLKVGFRLDDE